MDDELLARAKARLGTVLKGKYRIDRVLGVGGMAVVYAATHRNQAEFAVKMLHPELSMNAEIRARFLREGYVANTVKHPGAVAVVDDDTAEDGAAFLVMELLDGAPVEAIWEKRDHRLAARATTAIAHQLLDVLAAAHGRGIVHRDIKPANLFVTRSGAVKVLDFGIARLRDAAAGAQNATHTGMMLGTPAFMAPEQALAKASEIDAKTDLWAVGATMFTLLSGALVHEGDNTPQLLVRAATAPARPLASVAPDVPARISSIVDRALAYDKAARWPSAAAMRDALRDASLELFGAAPSSADLASLHAAESVAPDTRRAVAAPVDATAPMSRPPPLGGSAAYAPTRVPPTVDDPALQAPAARPSTTEIAAQPPRTQPARAPLLLVGTTTATPVSADMRAQPFDLAAPAGPRVESPRRAPLVLAGVAIALVAAGGAVVGTRALSTTSTAPPQATAPPTSSPGPAVTSAAPPVSATIAPSTAVPPSASASAITQSDGPPRAAPRATSLAPRPAASSKPSASIAQPPTAASTTPSPNCQPNYYFDPAGNKIFKPECFK